MRASPTPLPTVIDLVERAFHRGFVVISAVAFWTGIVAPLLYLPFLIPGVAAKGSLRLFLGLILLNYLALLFGYPYRNQSEGDSSA